MSESRKKWTPVERHVVAKVNEDEYIKKYQQKTKAVKNKEVQSLRALKYLMTRANGHAPMLRRGRRGTNGYDI